MDTKICLYCNCEHNIDKYTIVSWSGDGGFIREHICDLCKKKNKIKNINEFNSIKKYNKYKKYNITEKEYNYLFILQEGKCKICKKHQNTLNKKLAVDHCHTTNKVRGLLCCSCNLALGLFKDNYTFLKNAIKYLGGE